MSSTLEDSEITEIIKFYEISADTYHKCAEDISRKYKVSTFVIQRIIHSSTKKFIKLQISENLRNPHEYILNINIEYILSPKRLNEFMRKYRGVSYGDSDYYTFDKWRVNLADMAKDLLDNDGIFLVYKSVIISLHDEDKFLQIMKDSKALKEADDAEAEAQNVEYSPPKVTRNIIYTPEDIYDKKLLPKTLSDTALKKFIKKYSNLQDIKIPPGEKCASQILYLFGVHIGFLPKEDQGEYEVDYPGQLTEIYIFGSKEYIDEYIISQPKSTIIRRISATELCKKIYVTWDQITILAGYK